MKSVGRLIPGKHQLMPPRSMGQNRALAGCQRGLGAVHQCRQLLEFHCGQVGQGGAHRAGIAAHGFQPRLDDGHRIAAIGVAESGYAYIAESPRQRLLAQMLAYQIDGDLSRIGSAEDFNERLNASPALRSELGELAHVLHDSAVIALEPVPGLESTPLSLHASYSRREILTALGIHTETARPAYREGVVPLGEEQMELLFVTLDKRQGFHAAIAYHDYAISAEKFHWQSQNSAGPDTKAGKRYLESPANGWTFQLFIRNDRGSPYRACGPVTRESWSGDRPLNITWRLEKPLSPALFRDFSVLRDS